MTGTRVADSNPSVFDEPNRTEAAARFSPLELTFGCADRPSPGGRQALAVVARVVDTVRGRHTLPTSTSAHHPPLPALPIACRLDAVLP
jgi:hypothetical protein